ncbi:MAG: CBS domain-containing protein [Gemmataceae bacterium]
MLCPNCGTYNLQGNEICSNCGQPLTSLDVPTPENPIERSLMENTVSTLYPASPVTASPDTLIPDAIQQLLDNDIGALLVVDDDDKLLGIFSERDLLKKIAGLEPEYAERTIGEFMTPNPEVVSPSDLLCFALHKMDIGGYRHLPVVDNGNPVGVVSVRDMLRHIMGLSDESE